MYRCVILLLLPLALGGRFRSPALDLLSEFSRDIDDTEDIGFDNIDDEYLPEEDQTPQYRSHRFTGDEFILSRDVGKQREVRVFYNGVLALETVVPELGEKGLFLREITDGKKLVQLVYTNADTLADCDIDRSKKGAGEFVAKFLATSEDDVIRQHARDMNVDVNAISVRLQKTGATPILSLIDSRPLTGMYAATVQFDTLKDECRRLHHRIERERRQNEAYGPKKENEPEEYLTNDKSYFDRPKRSKREAETAVSSQAKSRVKRGMFIYPGTNWCGTGNEAQSFHDLGEQRGTDKCCRSHDFCPYTIEGFTTKYDLFNYRFHTISHCECDIRFRTCLKNIGDGVSDTVGKLFFDVMGLKCFVFVQEDVCVKRSWWGRCIKYKKNHTAVVRDADTF